MKGEAMLKIHYVPLQCGRCHHEWREAVSLPMIAEAFIARAKGWNVCPECGSNKVDMLLKPPNPFYVRDDKLELEGRIQ